MTVTGWVFSNRYNSIILNSGYKGSNLIMTIPDYTLRYSEKAKYLQLRISKKGLEVVVPGLKPVPQTIIDQFLQEKKTWIVRHWQRVLPVAEPMIIAPLQLPKKIVLPAIEQIWQVSYIEMDIAKVCGMTNQNKEIKLLGNINNQAYCVSALKEWLRDVAKQHLKTQLEVVAHQHGLSFGELTVRYTKTRWGSCSSTKDISLCCRLLFLPPHLMKHVLLHELCHTKVMAHSVKFWKLLRQLDEKCDLNRAELKVANEYVPLWAK